MFIFILIFLILKYFLKAKYYKKKSKLKITTNSRFIPYRSHNKKPTWVKDEVIYLKIHLANYGCRKIVIEFNKKHAHKNTKVSQSYVYNVIKTNNDKIIKQSLKIRYPNLGFKHDRKTTNLWTY